MLKYKIDTLDSFEFEKICSDIIKIKTGFTFKYFKKGKDGGIDCEYNDVDGKIIVQCKIRNNFSALKSAMIEEKKKIDKQKNVKEYYLLTSYELNPQQTETIFNIFKDEYMNNISNIISGNDIESLLDEPGNKNILLKYPSLWLCNSSIIEYINSRDVLIDSQYLIEQIKESDKYYVSNKYYELCLDKLSNNNCLLIDGLPGVGKSTISYKVMLFLMQKYMNNNIKVIYSSDSDYRALKKSISLDSNEYEVIFIDDILGKVCLEISNQDANGLIPLIQYIKSHKNKWLIMNTRMAILNSLYEESDKFKTEFEKLKIERVTINEYDRIEKARILFKRLKNDLTQDYIKELIKDKRYLNIINHKNFNPRLIEIITSSSFVEQRKPADYYDSVISLLNNPSDLWKEDYRHVLQDEDKIIIETIFSLSSNSVKQTNVEEIFWDVIKNAGIEEKGNNLFLDSMKRITAAYIVKEYRKDEIYLRLINNSLRDYFYNMKESSPIYIKRLLKNSRYADQLVYLCNWDLKKTSPRNDVYNYINDQLLDNYIKYSKWNLLLTKTRDNFKATEEEFKYISELLFKESARIERTQSHLMNFINTIFSKNYLNYVIKYFIDPIKANTELLSILCAKVSTEVINKLLCLWKNEYDASSYAICFEGIKKAIFQSYEGYFSQKLDSIICDNINEAIEYCKSPDPDDLFGLPDEYDVKNRLIDVCNEEFYDFLIQEFDDYKIMEDYYGCNVEEYVDSYDLAEEIKNYYSDNYFEFEHKSPDENDYGYDIDAMFDDLINE